MNEQTKHFKGRMLCPPVTTVESEIPIALDWTAQESSIIGIPKVPDNNRTQCLCKDKDIIDNPHTLNKFKFTVSNIHHTA